MNQLICLPLLLVLGLALLAVFINWTTGGAISKALSHIFISQTAGDNAVQSASVHVEGDPDFISSFPMESFLEIANLLSIIVQWLGYSCNFCLPNGVTLCFGFPLGLTTGILGLIVGSRLNNQKLIRRSLLAGVSPFIFLVIFVVYVIVVRNTSLDELLGYGLLRALAKLLLTLFPDQFGSIPPPAP